MLSVDIFPAVGNTSRANLSITSRKEASTIPASSCNNNNYTEFDILFDFMSTQNKCSCGGGGGGGEESTLL